MNSATRLTKPRILLLAAAALDLVLVLTQILTPLAVLLTFLLFLWAGLTLIRIALRRTRVIWHVRNRLIVTYVFMGVVPITLILALFFVAGWLLTAQFSGYLVSSAMDRREDAIRTPARLLALALPSDRLGIAHQLIATGIPSLKILVTGDQSFRYPADADIEMPPAAWGNYTGIVSKEDQNYLMSFERSGNSSALVLVPLTAESLNALVPGIGTMRMPEPGGRGRGIILPVNGNNITFSSVSAGRMPPQSNALDVGVTWVAPITMANWKVPNSGATSVILVGTRLSAVLGIVSPTRIDPSESVLLIFYLIAALLGAAWLLSVFIGVSMTRTITGAVHNLSEGTTRLGAGELSHRIPVEGHDQLADLGNSFNTMASQLEQLVDVAREKERLQSELAIASEVQTRLFPHAPPPARAISMLGVCHPARMVSGDYYDYFVAADGSLALALGDVAGKGISAALLMASIQSIMRTQLSTGGAALSPAAAVGRLNRLLYASTSAEKYATFFFGLYNEQNRELTYTNAGHLPPMLIRSNAWELLDVTGSVVGAFPSLEYQQQRISIGLGDLLIAYTDGITESENAYGEDFGCERLAELVMRHRDAAPAEIVAHILESVRDWSASAEQADDMTLMVVQGLV